MVKNQSYIKGFTLIELMITLTVAAIILTVATPSFRSIIQNTRLTTQINELAASLNLARSEAIQRGLSVTTCKSNDQDATPNCGGNWHDGWLVFEDTNGNGAFDAGADTIIRVTSALPALTTLVFPRNQITYDSTGFAIGVSNGTFILCDDRGATQAKGLIASNNGRIRTAPSANLTSCV
jgi:type IV fimbrial biogenesis protein FimT